MMAMASWCARAMRSSFYLLLNKIVSGGLVEVDAVAPADDDVNSIYQYPSDLMEDRRECSRFSRAGPKGGRRSSLGDSWKPDLHPCAHRSSPETCLPRRRIWIYLLALIPVLIILAQVIFDRKEPASPAQIENDTQVLAGIVQLYYFRLGIFFACMGDLGRGYSVAKWWNARSIINFSPR